MEYVLITGATSGIGYELAKIYAKKQYGLVLISSDENHLAETKNNLKEEFDVLIYTFAQDLSMQDAAIKVYQYVESLQIPISILINNAGYGIVGRTDLIDITEDINMIRINVETLVGLCKLFIPQMLERGNGKILNVASTGAFQPGPYTSTYFASKAFVLSYSRAIRYELKSKGIVVSTLCPGATKTNFFNKEKTQVPSGAMLPEVVAKIAVNGLNRKVDVTIPGFKNRFMQLFPRKLKMYVVAKIKE